MRTRILTLTPALPATLWLLALAHSAHAQWTNDPWNGMVPVCTAPEEQSYVRVCTLGEGNTLVAWHDNRNGVTQSYYQVLYPYGVSLLELNGRSLFDGNWSYGWGGPSINGVISDGQGGCIAVVVDNRDGSWDVYGQRFDPWD